MGVRPTRGDEGAGGTRVRFVATRNDRDRAESPRAATAGSGGRIPARGRLLHRGRLLARGGGGFELLGDPALDHLPDHLGAGALQRLLDRLLRPLVDSRVGRCYGVTVQSSAAS